MQVLACAADLPRNALNTFRQLINWQGWDNDETMIVCEDSQWYVADPIHIIR
jgi:hypothetical protein